MNWLFLNPIKADGWGGMEKWMVNLCRGLPAHGDTVRLLGRRASRWPEVCRAQGIPFSPFTFAGDFALWNVLRLRTLCRRHAVDVACVKGFRQARLVRLAAPAVTVAVKLPAVGQLQDDPLDRLTFAVCVDRVFVDNHAARRAFLRHPWVMPGKVVAVHNGVAPRSPAPDHAQRAALRGMLDLDADTVIVACVGSLVPDKRYGDALRAFGALAVRSRTILLMLGDGPERHALETLARELCPPQSVRFLGWREDAEQLLAGCDVLLHPSAVEGLPNVVLEAMAAGVPVVATDVGGTAEIIREGQNGYLVPCGAVDAMSACLHRLVHDAALRARLGAQAQQDVRTNFSLNAMVAGVRTAVNEAVVCRRLLRQKPQPLARRSRWVCHPDASLSPEVVACWDGSPPGTLVQRSVRSDVYRWNQADRIFYLKRYIPNTAWRLLGYALPRPRALDTFRAAQALTLRGAQVVPHLAAAWRRRFLLPRVSSLLTGAVPDTLPADQWLAQLGPTPTARRTFVRALAVWVAHLHGAGIAPHDLRASNFLAAHGASGWRFVLVDLDLCQVSVRPARPRAVQRNLHQLFRSFQAVATPTDVLRFLATYRRCRGWSRSRLHRLAVRVEQRLTQRGVGFVDLRARARPNCRAAPS